MKHFFKTLSALFMSMVLLCGTITAAGAAQCRVIVRRVGPCASETQTCPDTEECPDTEKCPDTEGCRSTRYESLCDLLTRCGLSAKQCEELSRLMKQAGYCPGNTCVPTTAPTEAPASEPSQQPGAEPSQQPTEEPSEAPAEKPTEAPAAPTEAPAEKPSQAPVTEPAKPTQPPTQAPTQKPSQPAVRPTEAPAAEPTEPAADSEAYALNVYEKEVITLVNKIRSENGLGYLRADAQLSRVARIKSQDMRDKGYFSHTSPTYGSPFDMMKRFGVSYRTAGENIAMGYRTPQAVVDGWMNSPGHRANILNGNYTRIGVGYIAQGNYWTQLFAG